jgi:3-oxoacyl-(acyl-carrier-protein) synthase III
MHRAIIEGVGSYLPERVLTNDELARMVDTSDEWIVERTGIRERRIAATGELTSDLAVAAATAALADANTGAEEIDLVLVATSTPDQTFPATATAVQARLGITRGAAFDLQAVCSGFVYALTTADTFIRSGQATNVLVIGAETFSRILDWTDRTTCVLFGDGAGAVVVKAWHGSGNLGDRGILAGRLRSDGRYSDKLYVDGGPSSTGTVGHLRMEGREVFKHAIVNMTVDHGRDIGGGRRQARRRRLVRAAPGQHPHPRRHGAQVRHRDRPGGDHGRQAWQHVGGIGSAGPRRGGQGRPHQAGRPGADGGHGRRLYLGCGAGALVSQPRAPAGMRGAGGATRD